MIVDHSRVSDALRRLAIPQALALVADQLLGIADTIVVGTLGTGPLAAVAAATGVFVTVSIALSAFGAGPRILGSQAIGADDLARFARIFRASFVVPLAIAASCALGALVFAHTLVHAMLPHVAAAQAGGDYLMLRAFSLIPIAVSTVVIVAFAAAGDTTLGIRTLVAINVIHIPLLAVLVLGLGTRHPFGLAGAGLASLLSEIVGMAYCLIVAARRPQLGLFARGAVELRFVRETTRLALPEFVFLVMLIVPEPMTVALLARYGERTVAAFRALSLVSDVTWAIPGAIGGATEIVIGQRLGARDIVGVLRFRRSATRVGVALGFGVDAFVALASWPLCALVTLNVAVASVAAAPLAAHAMILPVKTYAMTVLAPIRASGDVGFTMWMGIATSALVIVGIVIGARAGLGLWSVPLAWFVAWSLRSAMTVLRLREGRWKTQNLGA